MRLVIFALAVLATSAVAHAQVLPPAVQQEALAKLQQKIGAVEMENVQLSAQLSHSEADAKALKEENDKLKAAAKPSPTDH